MGKWQRKLFEHMMQCGGACYIKDILPETFTWGQYIYVYKAALLLGERGVVTVKKIEREPGKRKQVFIELNLAASQPPTWG